MSPIAQSKPQRFRAALVLRAIVVLGGLAASAAPARAEFKACFDGLNRGHSPAGSYKWSQSELDYAATQAAYPDLDYVNTIDNNGTSHFLTFCIQKNVTMLQNPHHFKVVKLEEAPDAKKMGDTATKIKMMWAQWRKTLDVSNYSDTSDANKDINKKHSAFAHAIWHLLGQWDKNGDGDGDGPDLTGQTLEYYKQYLKEADWKSGEANLMALVGSQKYKKGYKDDQDQIIECEPPPPGNDDVVPAPAALVLALTGIAPCLALRRRIFRRNAA
jgi:hypothetical protein